VEVEFFNEDLELPVFSQDKVLETISEISEAEDTVFGFLNIIFCSDEYLLNVNKEYLDHDYYTDIITFQYDDDTSETVSSDIFISLDRIVDNARELNIPFLDEFYRIVIHGILHLSGYKDKSPEDKKIMTDKENIYLSFLHNLS